MSGRVCLHLPSKITYHNAGAANLRRGNILVWEQSLGDRLRGEPLVLDARCRRTRFYADDLAVRRDPSGSCRDVHS